MSYNKRKCDLVRKSDITASQPIHLPYENFRLSAQETHDTTSQFTTRLECALHFVECNNNSSTFLNSPNGYMYLHNNFSCKYLLKKY